MNNKLLRFANIPTHSKRIVIWDLDGTIIDESPYRECTQKVFKNAFGICVSDDEYENCFANQSYSALKTTEYLISKGVIFSGIPSMKKIFDLIDEEFRNLIKLGRVEIIGKSVAIMHALNSLGHKQCLVTGTNRQIVDEVLNHLVPNFFEHIVTREDTFWRKPHPHPYELCIEKLAILPKDCVIVENTSEGLRAASCAGIKAIDSLILH